MERSASSFRVAGGLGKGRRYSPTRRPQLPAAAQAAVAALSADKERGARVHFGEGPAAAAAQYSGGFSVRRRAGLAGLGRDGVRGAGRCGGRRALPLSPLLPARLIEFRQVLQARRSSGGGGTGALQLPADPRSKKTDHVTILAPASRFQVSASDFFFFFFKQPLHYPNIGWR